MMRKLILLGVAAAGLQAATIAADSARGAQLFETQACVECHSINGRGGRLGPDLPEIEAKRVPAYQRNSLFDHEAEVTRNFDTDR